MLAPPFDVMTNFTYLRKIISNYAVRAITIDGTTYALGRVDFYFFVLLQIREEYS